ncbi:MAG: hypothetical protein RIF33_11625 [Cyclobacteriaceae bacterium]
MRHPTETTPISDAARYFSQRKNKTKQQKKLKPEIRDFRYPAFDHPEFHFARYERT